MFAVIAYDISDDGLRQKVSQVLADYGGQRVQKSVFECDLGDRLLRRLQACLEELVDRPTDSVRFYRLCEACRGRIEGRRIEPAAGIIL